jgi:hypothetical protein
METGKWYYTLLSHRRREAVSKLSPVNDKMMTSEGEPACGARRNITSR